MPTSNFQPSFAAGVIGPGLHGRIDLAKYDVALKVGKNVFVHAHGGVSNRAGTRFVSEVPDSSNAHILIPWVRDDNTRYALAFGDNVGWVVKDGAVVMDGGAPYEITTPFVSSALSELDFVQSADVMFFAHQDYNPRELASTGDTSWSFSTMAFNPTAGVPVISDVDPVSSTGVTTYTYKVSAVVDEQEGFASAAVSTTESKDLGVLLGGEDSRYNSISWGAVSGADKYFIYKERGGSFGYIGFAETHTSPFKDDNIEADLTTSPVESTDLFSGSDDYPRSVSLYQQRVVFGGSVNEPETVWMSRVGDFRNFTKSSTIRPDDRVKIGLTGQQVNRIRYIMQLRELLVFASGAEFSITGPDGVIDATNLIQTQYGYSGAAAAKPLAVEDTALFVDRTGCGVRDFRYALDQDGYAGNDLTIFASHFFEDKQIVSWCYAKNPYSVIWVALDDGSLLSFTYKREHQVWAWCEHDVGGQVESLTALPAKNEDEIYMIVRREVDGSDVRYIEKMARRSGVADANDAFFVDCGITYDGAATTTITGLDHLEGKDVVALADGNVVEGLTVSGGSVTLRDAASVVHIGLPYVSEMETLPPSVVLKDSGAARGKPHKVTRVRVQVRRSRGLEIGTGDSGRTTPHTTTAVDLASEIALETGMINVQVYPDWNKDGNVRIVQRYPLPMTILGISPELSIGRAP